MNRIISGASWSFGGSCDVELGFDSKDEHCKTGQPRKTFFKINMVMNTKLQPNGLPIPKQNVSVS